MSGTTRPNNKHLVICSGRAYPELAEQIAAELGVELVPSRQVTYANSEIYVQFQESVRGCDAFVIQSHSAPVNE
ncbi:ribose-phosphate pyrophosphokinase-like domain-containing protein, partial [Rhizobium ruizarguesonis]